MNYKVYNLIIQSKIYTSRISIVMNWIFISNCYSRNTKLKYKNIIYENWNYNNQNYNRYYYYDFDYYNLNYSKIILYFIFSFHKSECFKGFIDLMSKFAMNKYCSDDISSYVIF